MTNEEAKELLGKSQIRGVTLTEVVEVAISALEKQIPKAVEADEWPNRDRELIKRYWCPACEHEVDKDRDNWCSQCGQHLLWEEE